MKIAVIGPGAMGLLYGAKLSAVAEVIFVGNHPEHIAELQRYGVTIERNGETAHYNVPAILCGELQEPADLLLSYLPKRI